MLRSLITGANGFLGSHLAELLTQQGQAVYAAIHHTAHNLEPLRKRLTVLPCDMCDRAQMEELVRESQPDVIFHLAGQTQQGVSWQDPESTFTVNVFGTLNLLEAVRRAQLNPVVLVAGSSAEYGFRESPETLIREDEALRPLSPYGISKVAADLLGQLFWRTRGLRVVLVRPFAVTGPRKMGDVCADFARGIVAVERGHQEALAVGNLEAVRDFLDVQDGVWALWLVAQKGQPGEVYNVCSGVGRPVRQVLEMLLPIAHRPIPVVQDPSRMRPADEPVIVGDNTKLRSLGWRPTIPLAQTLRALLDYWRDHVGPGRPRGR